MYVYMYVYIFEVTLPRRIRNIVQKRVLHFTSLHFTSLHFTLLPFTSFHFTLPSFILLHFTSLHQDNHAKWDTGQSIDVEIDVSYSQDQRRGVEEDVCKGNDDDGSLRDSDLPSPTSFPFPFSSSYVHELFQWFGRSYTPTQYKYDTYIQLVSSKISLLLTACFLFFTSTTLVHFTLRGK